MSVIPIKDLPDSKVIPIDELPEDQSQEPSGFSSLIKQKRTDEGSSPLDPVQRGMMSIPTTIDAKRELLGKLVGQENVTQLADNRLGVLMNGKVRPIDPKPNGMVQWLRDLPGDIADLAGPAMPIAGQIGADVLATPAAVASGGLGSIPIYAGSGAAGAGAGSLAREALSSVLTGQQPNMNAVGTDVVSGGIGGGLGQGAILTGKFALKQSGKALSKVAAKLGDSFPEVMNSVFNNFGVKKAKYFVDELRAGRTANDILLDGTTPKSDPQFAKDVARNLFFGNKMANDSPGLFISQYKRLLHSSGSQENAQLVRNAYKDFFKLSDDTLIRMESRSVSDLTDPSKFDTFAMTNLAKGAQKTIDETLQVIGKRRDSLIRYALDNPRIAGQRVGLGDLTDKLMQNLEQQRIMVNGEFNPEFTDEAAKDIYGKLIKSLQERPTAAAATNIANLKKQGLYDFLPKEVREGALARPKPIGSMTVEEMHNFAKDKQALLDQAFDKKLSSEAKRPLAEFMSDLRGRYYEKINGLQGLNQKLSTLIEAKDFFSGDEVALAKKMRDAVGGAINDIPGQEKARYYQNQISQLDSLLQRKIMPKIKDVSAAQELSGINYPKSLADFIKAGKTVFGEDEVSILMHDKMNLFNQAVGNRFKFMRDLKDHIFADEINTPVNFFKSRALAYMGAATLGIQPYQPLIGPVMLGAGTLMANPKRFIQGAEIARNLLKGAASQKFPQVGSQALGRASRAGATKFLASVGRQETGK